MKQIFDVRLSTPKKSVEELKKITKMFPWYTLFIFFIITILYLELVYRLSIFKAVDGDYLFSV
ncbi:MAG: hypothetical protein WCG28_03525, partial [bacterium]